MRILAAIGALAIILGIVAAGYFLGGFYNVAAATDDSAPVSWFLTRVRSASIARHSAADRPPFSADDPAQIQEGARRYAQLGCTHCHGAPGAEWSKFSEGLNPGPPDLKEIVGERDISSIFWVAKNGIRMTGMPSFGKAGAQDTELWQVAAFVKKLPTVSESDYKSWTASSSR